MITIIEGGAGWGKTTALKFFEEVEKKEGRECLWGFDLTMVDRDLRDCTLFLDEEYRWYDCRSTMSKGNKLFTYFAIQNRQRGVNLYVSAMRFEMVDKRIRRNAEVRGICFPGENKIYVHLMKPEGQEDDEWGIEWVPKVTLEIAIPRDKHV